MAEKPEPENPENPGPGLITRLVPHLPYAHASEIGLVRVSQRVQLQKCFISPSRFVKESETERLPPFRYVTR